MLYFPVKISTICSNLSSLNPTLPIISFFLPSSVGQHPAPQENLYIFIPFLVIHFPFSPLSFRLFYHSSLHPSFFPTLLLSCSIFPPLLLIPSPISPSFLIFPSSFHPFIFPPLLLLLLGPFDALHFLSLYLHNFLTSLSSFSFQHFFPLLLLLPSSTLSTL